MCRCAKRIAARHERVEQGRQGYSGVHLTWQQPILSKQFLKRASSPRNLPAKLNTILPLDRISGTAEYCDVLVMVLRLLCVAMKSSALPSIEDMPPQKEWMYGFLGCTICWREDRSVEIVAESVPMRLS